MTYNELLAERHAVMDLLVEMADMCSDRLYAHRCERMVANMGAETVPADPYRRALLHALWICEHYSSVGTCIVTLKDLLDESK